MSDDDTKVGLHFGAMAEKLSTQLRSQGVKLTPRFASRIDNLARAITLCHLHGVTTEAETHRARKRLIKKIEKEATP